MTTYTTSLLKAICFVGALFVVPDAASASDTICLMDSNASNMGRISSGMGMCAYSSLPQPYYASGGVMITLPEDNRVNIFKATRFRVSDQWDRDWTMSLYSSGNDGRMIFNPATMNYAEPVPYAGVRINAGSVTVTPIDAHGVCRYVQNNTEKDIFVPFKSAKEWADFRANATANYNGKVVLSPCSLPCPGKCAAHGFYFGPTSFNRAAGDEGLDKGSESNWYPTELPYAREGTLWPADADVGKLNRHTFNYKCKWKTVENVRCATEGTKDASGKCLDAAADSNCCLDYASDCVSHTDTWREVWELERPKAGASGEGEGARENGWTWPTASKSHSFIIPGLSTTRNPLCGSGSKLQQIGNDCMIPPPDPNAVKDGTKGGKRDGDDDGDGGGGTTDVSPSDDCTI